MEYHSIQPKYLPAISCFRRNEQSLWSSSEHAVTKGRGDPLNPGSPHEYLTEGFRRFNGLIEVPVFDLRGSRLAQWITHRPLSRTQKQEPAGLIHAQESPHGST